jgi:hypothetical protein
MYTKVVATGKNCHRLISFCVKQMGGGSYVSSLKELNSYKRLTSILGVENTLHFQVV